MKPPSTSIIDPVIKPPLDEASSTAISVPAASRVVQGCVVRMGLGTLEQRGLIVTQPRPARRRILSGVAAKRGTVAAGGRRGRSCIVVPVMNTVTPKTGT